MHRLFTIALAFVVLHVLFVAPIHAEVELEIGPDTTVIDGPLNEDGTIDYLSYVNGKLREKVKLEDNFAVVLLQTIHPEDWTSESVRQQSLAWLGVQQTDPSMYFRRYPTFMRAQAGESSNPSDFNITDSPWYGEVQRTAENPWSEEDYPEVKRWLDESASSMDMIAQGLDRNGFAIPFFVEEGKGESLCMVPLAHLGHIRGLARAYASRAELKIHDGDIDGAWMDVVVIHRLAQITEEQPVFISRLVAYSVHQFAIKVSQDILNSSDASIQQLRRGVKETQAMPRILELTDAVDTDSRLMMVDLLLRCRIGPIPDLQLSEKTYQFVGHELFDINFALRELNRLADLQVEMFSIESPKDRLNALEQFEQEVGQRCDQAELMFKGNPEAIKAMRGLIEESNIYTAGGLYLFIHDVFPRPAMCEQAKQSIQMALELEVVAFAIAAYHADRGKFPPDLNALSLAYLLNLPVDFATGELPVYRVEDGVAVVYSFGADLDDDGGVEGNSEDGDIVMRISRE